MDFGEFTIGEYVRDQYFETHGLMVTAVAKGTKGFTPVAGAHESEGGAARAFDTARPRGNDQGDLGICTQWQGDKRLGSPNKHCPNVSNAKGTHTGGRPFLADGVTPNPFSNCEPLGNVLIIQEVESTCPQTSSHGGAIEFEFVTPVRFLMTKLLDLPTGGSGVTQLEVTYNGGTTEIVPIPGAGSNGVADIVVDKDNVTKISVAFDCYGSVANIVFQSCPQSAF